MSDPVVVHHLNNSRSMRVLWLLEELEVPYTVVRYERRPSMLAPETLKAVHPLGKAPVVVDGGTTVAESGAILQYLVERRGGGRLAPAPGSAAWVRYLYFLHYAEGSLMPPLLLSLVLGKMGPLGWPAKPYVKGQLDLHLDFLERELGAGPWFLGAELSAADVQLSFPLEAAATRAKNFDARPGLRAFLERVHARPAYQRALAKGGPFALGG